MNVITLTKRNTELTCIINNNMEPTLSSLYMTRTQTEIEFNGITYTKRNTQKQYRIKHV